jgi:hypothetical protein
LRKIPAETGICLCWIKLAGGFRRLLAGVQSTAASKLPNALKFKVFLFL